MPVQQTQMQAGYGFPQQYHPAGQTPPFSAMSQLPAGWPGGANPGQANAQTTEAQYQSFMTGLQQSCSRDPFNNRTSEINGAAAVTAHSQSRRTARSSLAPWWASQLRSLRCLLSGRSAAVARFKGNNREVGARSWR